MAEKVQTDVIINYQSVNLDKVGADLKAASVQIDGLVLSSQNAFKATTELENKFKGLQKSTNAYTTALSEARGAAMGLAAGIGPLGAVLGSFGPWGVAAAAGIGLVTNAFTYLSEGAGKMGDEIVNLTKFANVTGLTTTQVVGLSEAGQELGISAEAIKTGIEKFTVGLSEARKGSGDLFEQLRDIDEQLAIQISSTRSSSQALDLLAKAYSSTADATTRAALARAAFGKSGVSTGPVLEIIAAEGVEKYAQEAAKALGITEEWAKEVDRLRKANKDLAGDIETVNATIYTKEILERQNQFLQAQLRIAQAMRESAKKGEGFVPDFGAGNVVPFAAPQDISGEAGRGGMARGASAAAASAAAEVAALEQKWLGVSEATRKASQVAEAMIPVVRAVGGAAQQTAQFSADIAIELAKGKTAADALATAADKLIASQERAAASVAKTTEEMEQQNELAKARNLSDEKRIASQQAYEKVIKELGDTEEGRAAALARSDAVAESYRIKMRQAAGATQDAADAAGKLAGNVTAAADAAVALMSRLAGGGGLSGGTLSLSEATGGTVTSGGGAEGWIPDQTKYTTRSRFEPNVMPSGTLEFSGDPRISVAYRGGGGGRRIGPTNAGAMAEMGVLGSGFSPAMASGMDFNANAKAAMDAQKNNTDAIEKLSDSTDRLNATNQELLSPYYTMDPRTSHIGFRSQGMAAGGYVDVPGVPSANDNLIAQIPVASGERIYVDPMSVKRGNAGTTINITAPMMFSGPVNRDEVGRTVYQTMQIASRSIAAAQK